MKRSYRTVLLIGLLLIIIGFIISMGAFIGGGSIGTFRNRFQSADWRENMNNIILTNQREKITSIDINLALAEVIIEKGNTFEIKTYDIPENEIFSSLNTDGKLLISNETSTTFRSFFRTRWINKNPQVIITLPKDLSLESLKVKIGAGSFNCKQISVETKEAALEVGAGELIFKNLSTQRLSVDCGMGSVVLAGMLKGPSIIECGMGSVKLFIEGNRSDYSYTGNVGLGNISVNSEQISGIGKNTSSQKKNNHLEIECGMGDVTVIIE